MTKGYDHEIALAGNPNVGKSTIFNQLTGLRQHTGNWSGKTVENAYGYHRHGGKVYRIVDLPGTYSLSSGSTEEEIAFRYIRDIGDRYLVIVVSALALERSLGLVIQILSFTQNVILCVNMIDEAARAGMRIDEDELHIQLGIPVVLCSARDPSTLSQLYDTIYDICDGDIRTYKVRSLKGDEVKACLGTEKCAEIIEPIVQRICKFTITYSKSRVPATRLDRILTSKLTGIPMMLLLYGLLFFITAVAANYPSEWLGNLFALLKGYITAFLDLIHTPGVLSSILIDGVYTTLSWVVAVMLPPMAIFFPLFGILEDSGYLPRVAFNLDRAFSKARAHPKQSMTMAMGMGCNACGVMGCRIIDTDREKKIAVVTNNFIPCNGRLPALIAISSIFFAKSGNRLTDALLTAGVMVLIFAFAVILTLLCSRLLADTLYKGEASGFVLELPPYRKPDILHTVIRSFLDKTWKVLLKAVYVSTPAGAVIWCLTFFEIEGVRLLDYCIRFLDPLGLLLSLDGVILLAFILGFPANETVIPVMLMSYMSASVMMDYSSYSELGAILTANGWTMLTAVCFLILCVCHYPCSTACLTIYQETKSLKTTLLSVVLPTVIGILLCFMLNLVHSVF